jgi:hypothetical protein
LQLPSPHSLLKKVAVTATVPSFSRGMASVGKASVLKASVGKASVGKASVGKASVPRVIDLRASVASVRKGGVRKASVLKVYAVGRKVVRRQDRDSSVDRGAVVRRMAVVSEGCSRTHWWLRLIRTVTANCQRKKLTGPSLL